jgi:hypothetical protein
MVLTNWKFVATARGIGFQPVCENTCVGGDAGPRRAIGRPGSRSKVLTNWKFVATDRGIGFQPVESKPIPLAQNPPPTHDLPRRGYFSQPGVAASAATPGKTPPRATSTLSGLCSFRSMENRRIHMSGSRRTKQSLQDRKRVVWGLHLG